VAEYGELRVPFGEKEGRLYAPDEVERGLACQCHCPACGTPLVANKPKVKRDYFSHHRTEDCAGGYESALHKMGKQIIEDAGWVTVPHISVPVTWYVSDGPTWRDTVDYDRRRVNFTGLVVEQQADRWRPDITATLKNGQTLYIEIKVTHGVEDPKADDLDNLMEIDLSGIRPEEVRDLNALTHLVLFAASRRWYRCSLYDDLKRVRDAYDKLKARAKRDLEREAERARLEERKEQYREEFAEHVERAELMLDPNRQEAIHQTMQNKCQAAIEAEKQRLETAGHAPPGLLPFGVGQRYTGDWIVKIHYTLWQSFVIERFVIGSPVGTKFTVPEVVLAVDQRFGYIKWMKELADLKLQGKKQGRQRGKWYADTGVWFLTEDENKTIQTPYYLMLRYLRHLATPPFGYLQEVQEGLRFIVHNNQPMTRYNEHQSRLQDIESKTAFNRQEREAERAFMEAEREKELKKDAEEQNSQWDRNRRAIVSLYTRSVKEAVICSYCHQLFEDLALKECPNCQAGNLNPIELTDEYVASYPHRLRSMSKVRR
jgi:ssDNA-binding Zn-finger/Zn-ribbon topoisomerase 1